MGGENVLQTIPTTKYDTYPGLEDNEEEEEMTESLDIHTGRIDKLFTKLDLYYKLLIA